MNTEITKQSVELRRNLFKDTKITSSKELKNLYLKLNHISIQKLRMKYYHVKENKTVEINKGKFVPDNISKKSYIMTHTTIGLENQKLEVIINIYSNKDINKFINILISTIEYICGIAPISVKKIKLNYYLTENKKEIKSSSIKNKNRSNILTKDEINSGFCNNGFFESEITIYRIEEVIKVTIHELIHAFNYDYRSDSDQIINHYQQRYNITSKNINT